MIHKPTKGDLVHIPANSYMIDPNNIKDPKRYYVQTTPCMGVLLDKIDDQMTTVYIGGEYWAVEDNNIYPYNEHKQRRTNG